MNRTGFGGYLDGDHISMVRNLLAFSWDRNYFVDANNFVIINDMHYI